MKITGIICEYNPFHNGHQYQISEIKKYPDDYVIAVMSGDFIQRGGPAIIDKYSRTLMALKGGVDLVIELPVIYSTGSARDFAYGGISLLDSLGCVDELSFGCESPKGDSFNEVATLMKDNAEKIEKEIAEQMKNGNAYPKAREIVLAKYLDPHIVEGLNKPNNILATEYRIALAKLRSNIKPSPILRRGSDYNDEDLSMVSNSSATAIRNAITSCEDISVIKNHVPQSTYDILSQNFNTSFPIVYNNFSKEIGYKLLTGAKHGFEDHLDVTRELSDKIINNLDDFKSVDQFCEALKTKDITYSRISRCMTHILLDIKKDMHTDDGPGYARILGFRKRSDELLGIIKEKSRIPMISKLADAPNHLSKESMEMLEKDIEAAHIYEHVSAGIYQNDFINEYKRQIVIE